METQKTTERNHSVDFLKLICAILVVFIHCSYPYKHEFLPITDVAVPLFFCTSGYLLYGAKRNWTRIGRIAQIFAWSAALYLAKTEIFWILTLHKLWVPTLHDVTNCVFFNDVAFSSHLWYLPAYVYVLIIAYFIDKYGLWKLSFCAIIPLLLVGVFIKYSIADTCPEQIQYFRNAYFTGLPYFLLGAYIKGVTTPPRLLHNCKFLCKKNVKVLLFGAVAVLLAARYILRKEGFVFLAFREMDLLLLTGCIFFFTTLCVQREENTISRLGRKYSLYIYIFHMLIISVCEKVATYVPATISVRYMYVNPFCVFDLPVPISDIYMFINPFVVFVLSVGVSAVLAKLKIIRV